MAYSNFEYFEPLLGALSKFPKSAINIAMSVCPKWHQPAVTGRILMNFAI